MTHQFPDTHQSWPVVKLETSIGPVEMTAVGKGRVSIRTDAHINDDAPAIDWRGESWLVHLFLVLDDATWKLDDGYSAVQRRRNRSDAPRTYRDKILTTIVTEAREYIEKHPDFIARGEYASACNDLRDKREDVRELEEKLREAQAREAEAEARALAAHRAIPADAR